MDRHDLLKHFSNNDERLRFGRIIDLAMSCRSGVKRFSDFTDPIRLTSYVSLLTRRQDFRLLCATYGGYDGAERQMLGFSSEHEAVESDDFPIKAVQVKFNNAFNKKPSHRDYLGSVLGLGIDRSKIGDIIPGDSGCIMYIAQEISRYVIDNLISVGNVKVSASDFNGGITDSVTEAAEKRIIISSMRVDNIISAVFNISRSKSAALVDSEKVFVNWALCTSGSKNLCEGDKLTLRGYGRAEIKEIAGMTKKDRIIAIVSVNT